MVRNPWLTSAVAVGCAGFPRAPAWDLVKVTSKTPRKVDISESKYQPLSAKIVGNFHKYRPLSAKTVSNFHKYRPLSAKIVGSFHKYRPLSAKINVFPIPDQKVRKPKLLYSF